jgi:DNA polymerase
VIVTLGRYSMAKFFPGARISAVHGQARKIGGRIVVAMFHPAAALHQQTLRQTLIDDFKTAIPAALAEAAKMAPPPKPKDDGDEKPPEQLSLF